MKTRVIERLDGEGYNVEKRGWFGWSWVESFYPGRYGNDKTIAQAAAMCYAKRLAQAEVIAEFHGEDV